MSHTKTYTVNRYVVGFYFTEDKKEVILIQKARPEWQKGFFNGVGGHIEPGEMTIDAMVREFTEEAGIVTLSDDWTEFVLMRGPDYELHLFSCFGKKHEPWNADSTEPVSWIQVDKIWAYNVLPNLRWLIPLALEKNIEIPIRMNVYGK